MSKLRFSVLIGIIFLAALSRLIPHPFNFTPITAIALFGGAHFANKKQAYLVTFGAMIVSDIFIGGYHSLLPLIYLYFGLAVLVGAWLRNHKNPLMIAGATLTSSIVFFIVTNFAVWVRGSLYEHTFNGLMQCYAVAVPFFQNTVLGDAIYTAVLFGSFAFVEKRFPSLAPQNS